MMGGRVQPTDDREIRGILDHLSNNPSLNHATATSRQVRAIMLSTGGEIMALGQLWVLKAKHLGAGAYRLSCKKTMVGTRPRP